MALRALRPLATTLETQPLIAGFQISAALSVEPRHPDPHACLKTLSPIEQHLSVLMTPNNQKVLSVEDWTTVNMQIQNDMMLITDPARIMPSSLEATPKGLKTRSISAMVRSISALG